MDPDDLRREFLKKAAIAIQALITLVLSVPLACMFGFPLWGRPNRRPGNFLDVGDVDQFRTGEPHKIQLTGNSRDAWALSRNATVGSIWVIRRGSDEFDVFSTTCPHLGCAINLDGAGHQFMCPCHGSHFSLDGGRIEDSARTNPSPRGMDRLQIKLVKNRLLVQYRRFRPGTKELIELV
jgi:menaquinol-cytochrome c reductase iron-sulfur subunit